MAGDTGDTATTAVAHLPHFYHTLRALLHGQHYRSAEAFCTTLLIALPSLPFAAQRCVCRWPQQLVQDESVDMGIADTPCAFALLAVAMAGGVSAEDAVLVHVVHASLALKHGGRNLAGEEDDDDDMEEVCFNFMF